MSALCWFAVEDSVELQRSFLAFFIRTPPHLRECRRASFVRRRTSASNQSRDADPETVGTAAAATVRGAIEAAGADAPKAGTPPRDPATKANDVANVVTRRVVAALMLVASVAHEGCVKSL